MSTTTRTRPRLRARTAAIAALAALVLASCGSSGGDDAADTTEAKGKAETTTTEAAESTTTTEADDGGALPTTKADAPSGDWISVRFNVAAEPEPKDFNPGSAEARLYDIEPTCPGDEPCSLELAGGGEDGSFAMPDTEPISGEAIVMEADGTEWTSTDTPEPYGCTDELDGPYVSSKEDRTFEPVVVDGEIVGLVGTLVYTDTLTDEGRAAGCPASAEGVYGYAVVAAPNDGIRDIDEYDVDGSFRQTIEVTKSAGQTNPLYQVGGISTSLPEYDVDLSGSCADGECSVDFTQINGDGNERSTELTSEDGRSLNGTFDETGGCADDKTGDIIFESGAYDSTGTYEDLTPIWIEDGEVKAFVGRYAHDSTPTAKGKTDPNCSTPQSIEGWVYLVDADSLGVS